MPCVSTFESVNHLCKTTICATGKLKFTRRLKESGIWRKKAACVAVLLSGDDTVDAG